MKPSLALILFAFLAIISCRGAGNGAGRHDHTQVAPIAVGDTVEQLGDHLWYIFQDSKNVYWFASDGEGVFQWDGITIIQYTTADGLAGDRIRQISEDKEGNLFFSTLNGISKFDGLKFTTLQVIVSNEWKLEDDDLWFQMIGNSSTGGAYRYDGKTLYHLEFPKHYLHDDITRNSSSEQFNPYAVYSIYKDHLGAIWFGTAAIGACRFDGQSVKWMYDDDLTYTPSGGSFGIRSVYEDKSGDFWICNTRQRFKFDFEKTKQKDRLIYETKAGIGNSEIFDGENALFFSHITEDNEGNIWFCTYSKGVYKYDGKNITHYPITDQNKTVNIISLYKDRQGKIWLGTADNGVFRMDGEKGERVKS